MLILVSQLPAQVAELRQYRKNKVRVVLDILAHQRCRSFALFGSNNGE